jgi:mannose-6-phosphate isomerase-like protein (cupin superfamily)
LGKAVGILACVMCFAFFAKSQTHIDTDTIGLKTLSDKVYNKPLFSDSLASSFVIVIRDQVKPHKHVKHSEHVVVLSGKAQMTLRLAQGDKVFSIKKGDVIFIPKNTVHSVIATSKNEPLKVLSVQSPNFDGTDRVFVDQ